ncbi:SDR family oxidoreductase [Bordetella bronchiseptica]|uniref:SDR family oxidoreductase n=1 Tax=Bordetella bronchiseptica TaxID=518 RepID=UPI00403D48C6
MMATPAGTEDEAGQRARRTYVVSGSASGIGAATRRALEAAGATVIGIDLRNAEIEIDLSDAGQVGLVGARLAAQGVSVVDGVLTCAGVSGKTGSPEAIVAVNYFGTTGVLEQLHPFLRRSGHGRAVALSSIAMLRQAHAGLYAACLDGRRADALDLARAGGLHPRTAYETTKRAVSAWIRHQALQDRWVRHGVLLNAVAPGIIDTPLTRHIVQDRQAFDMALARAPQALGVGRPEHVAALAAFLAGPANGFITGQTIFVDGGHEAQVGAGLPALSAQAQADYDALASRA